MKDKLITKNYIEILAANFLLFFGFWLLMPVLPFYLAEVFDANKTTIGAVLSCYTIAALCIRPFSGYLLDTFARKPLYLLALFHFYRHLRRISHCRNTHLIYFIPHYTRSIIRHGDSQRKYHCH